MKDITVNRFRKARGLVLSGQIARLSHFLNRPVTILDIGGRADYWDNLSAEHIAEVRLLNNDPEELGRKSRGNVFVSELGDARCLSRYPDKSVDLVHSNSVIEHVGAWPDMCAMADEALRVGISGWVQTPAWEFPIEPHFRLPFLHWFAQPLRRKFLAMSMDYGRLDVKGRRQHIDRINLLSRAEMKALFPDCSIFVERLALPKSYTARWGPGGVV